MKNLLANLNLVKFLARDVHYTFSGANFYSIHKMADEISTIENYSDSIKELYYLGSMYEEPPLDIDIARLTINKYENIIESKYIESMAKPFKCLHALLEAINIVIYSVEQAKKLEGIQGGIQAVLDGISQDALKYRFFINNTLGIKG